jgi:hypothetical protein
LSKKLQTPHKFHSSEFALVPPPLLPLSLKAGKVSEAIEGGRIPGKAPGSEMSLHPYLSGQEQ